MAEWLMVLDYRHAHQPLAISHDGFFLVAATTIAAAAQMAGAMPAMKMRSGVHCIDSSRPPTDGPTIEPTRPTPSAQPTPVARIGEGQNIAASAVRPAWAPCSHTPSTTSDVTITAADDAAD